MNRPAPSPTTAAKKPSRGPAEAALASAEAASARCWGGDRSDQPLLRGSTDRTSSKSDVLSTQCVTGLTTDGGDDVDYLLGPGQGYVGLAPNGDDTGASGDRFDDIFRSLGGDGGGGDDDDDIEQRRHGAGLVLDGCRNVLVMCDTYAPATMTPLRSNTRAAAAEIFDHPNVAAEEPWFGIEQEYTLLDAVTRWPIGWPPGGYPAPQGPYYCGVGADRMFGRSIAEAHYTACHFAGLDVSGLNAEVMPGQWEFQVGPCVGVDSGDQLWMARYILQRVCELTGSVVVTLDPKPVQGDWNGAGAHCNYSTRSMREVDLGGMKEIERAIKLLKVRNDESRGLRGVGRSGGVCSHTLSRSRHSLPAFNNARSIFP